MHGADAVRRRFSVTSIWVVLMLMVLFSVNCEALRVNKISKEELKGMLHIKVLGGWG